MSLGGKVEVSGRVVLVTGAAQGMGKLWARHFARDGARLALWDLNKAGVEETGGMLRELGGDVVTDVVDVTDAARVREAAGRLKAKMGPVDVLVNNAGVVVGGPFDDVPEEKQALVLDVNLKGMLFVTKAILPQMVERGKGHVINVSSASGFIGVPFMPAYTASKWGVIGFTESLRLEMELLGRKDIRFTLFCPSYVDTGMFKGVKAPTLVPLLSPEDAVEKGYSAFRRGAYMIREPFMVKLTPALRALLPLPVFDRVSRTLGVTTSMKEWTGRDKKG